MPSVFIDGGHGTTGLEIADRLSGRGSMSLIKLDDDMRKDTSARRQAINDADAVILCLPDDAAREAVAMVDNDRTVIIDASTAHRTAPDWTYGFPEVIGRDRVASAKRISNPGCYSTGFIALVAPLTKAGLIPLDHPVMANAVSGYSGGGKAMIAEFEDEAAPTAWRTYALGLAHKHVPEMQAHTGLTRAPIFAPAVVNVNRGMIVDIPLMLGVMTNQPSVQTIRDTLRQAYQGSSLITVIDDYDAATLSIERCSNTDRIDIFVFANEIGDQVRLVAAFDNLGKGASGAAVQSLNLVLGHDETEGLKL
jgi:N-acetyl-gamma-glutamyl-phosphate reductase